MKEVSVVLVGIGGYGNNIVKNILPNRASYGVRIAGAVDPNWQAAPLWEELEKLGVPHFDSLEDFYAENKADLAILATPIHFHERQAITAMKNGSDVLCEKPTAATLTQSAHMEAVARETGRNLHIGFQLSYVGAVQALKKDIMDGLFGKPLHLQSLICWPRNSAYYARSWCAKRKWNGAYVLDSIAMNACAHYLHLMYFLLGEEMGRAAQPEKTEAILCRANPIETFDTAMLRVYAKDAVLDFLATHTCEKKVSPTMHFVFEKAVVEMTEGEEEDAIRAVLADGTVKTYGPVKPEFFQKIPYCCQVVRGEKQPVCTPETASAHLKTVNAVTELVPVVTLPGTASEKDVMVVEGMNEILEQAFASRKMPWELTDRFGAPTQVTLTDYQWRDTL